MTRLSFALALGCVLVVGSKARAVVEAEMPLAQLVKDSQLIAVMTLEQVDHESGKGVLKLERMLQGDTLPSSIPIKLLAAAGGEGNPHDMLQRVEDGTRLVIFLSSLSPQEHQAFGYGNGSWFKLRGVGELSRLKTVFLQGEPYLRRTFHGEDADLVKLLEDSTAGSGTLPDLDEAAKPGLGPILQDAPATPEVVAVAPGQIELGPAWQIDGPAAATATKLPQYAVGFLLLVSALGLVFMLTRSLPEKAA
jgi:hypothetical protein